ncbi:MAG TPA: ABC transporter substrate-binding protein [Streptosporangiaceae bacterium]|jgi:NitT/TauT family transport system substrate-binding protein
MRRDPAGGLQHARGRGRRRLLGAAAGLALLVSAGCAGSSSAGGTVPNTITIGAVPGIDTAPVFLAWKAGYFADAGMANVRIQPFATHAAEMQALLKGQVDITASDYGTVFYEQAKSPGLLRVLADGYDAGPSVVEIVTLPGSGIHSPADLAGQTIGVPAETVLPGKESASNSPVSLESAAAAEELKIFLGAGVDTINWWPIAQEEEVTGLSNAPGGLHAVLLTEPNIYNAASGYGATEVLDAFSGSTAGLPLTGYVTESSWASHHPAAVADFQAAIARAQGQASLTGQVQQVLPATSDMTQEDAALSAIGTYPTTTSAVGLDRVVRLLGSLGVIDPAKEPSVGPMIIKPAG